MRHPATTLGRMVGARRRRCEKIGEEETVSRQGAKRAKLAKRTNEFHFALLCDLVALRELF